MAKNYLSETEYWQVKATGEIMEVPKAERSKEWMTAYRQVRLFHHAESEVVMICDYHDHRSQENCWQNGADEVDLKSWKYWKLLYDNPDL